MKKDYSKVIKNNQIKPKYFRTVLLLLFLVVWLVIGQGLSVYILIYLI